MPQPHGVAEVLRVMPPMASRPGNRSGHDAVATQAARPPQW
jgi:hypothetical protein